MLSGAACAALFAVGCGGETTDITAAVDDTNKTLKPDGASIDCPDTVDGGKGTKFDCTVEGAESGKSEKIQLKVIKDGIAPVSEEKYVAALQSVVSP